MTATTANIEKLEDTKFYNETSDLKRYRIKQLKSMDETDSKLVVEYINSRIREGHLKPASRANTIDRLSGLCLFNKNKSFSEMTIEDIFSYLDKLRRIESEDPMHKWVGTYNHSVIKIIHFSNGCMIQKPIQTIDLSPHF